MKVSLRLKQQLKHGKGSERSLSYIAKKLQSKNRGKFNMFECITFNPKIMGGRACIRGMRITVSLAIGLVANGMTVDEILKAYPYL